MVEVKKNKSAYPCKIIRWNRLDMGSTPIISTGSPAGVASEGNAAVAELVDALDLKSSCGDTVRVRFPPAAPAIAGIV